MILSKFDDLRRQKALREKRDISLRKVAVETGLSLGTIRRLTGQDMERVYLSTLDILCEYFGVESINQLIEFEPNAGKGEGSE